MSACCVSPLCCCLLLFCLSRLPFDQHIARATSASADQDFETAVKEYCQAISQMMGWLREVNRNRKASDSTIDL